MYKLNIITVSGLNMYIKSLLDSDKNLKNIFVEGEISNLTNHYKSGHIYLTLKDDKSVIKAVMFAQNACRLRFNPCDGMKVICRGRVSLYEASGQYQVYIDDMQPSGVGALAIAFEQLKEKLSKEGLFDSGLKKPLPKFPQKIGVITSSTGAAFQDIKNILERRYPIAEVMLYPSLVQGEGAPKQLINGIKHFNNNNNVDVIIIGRGGGSLEDLWAFNDEALAREIAKSEIPVISAVGHETDFTICDFVSDLRAPTPSAAAELSVPDKNELLDIIISSYAKLKSDIKSIIDKKEDNLTLLKGKLNIYNTDNLIKEESLKLDALSLRLSDSFIKLLQSKKSNLDITSEQLNALSPLNVLMRGYSLAFKEDKVINTVNDIEKEDIIKINLSDGHLKCTVNDIKRGFNNE